MTWYKIPKAIDLNGNSATQRWTWYHDYLYVKPSTSGRFNTPGKAIVDLMIGSPTSKDPPAYVVKDAQTSIGRPKSRLDISYNYHNWDLRPDGIWVKYDKDTAEDAIKDVSYLFGNDVIEPRDDWKLVQGYMKLQSSIPIRIIIRKTSPPDSNVKERPMLKVTNDGHFKILQLSDMHFSSNYGVCKDQFEPLASKECKADSKSTNFIHQVLDIEKPQLVVVTGDILDGYHTFDYQTALLKALSPMISRNVPFAIALGEHDINKYVPREQIIDFITTLPSSLMLKTEAHQSYHNITNYALPIYNTEGTQIINAVYVLDLYSSSTKIANEQDFSTEEFLKGSYESFAQKPQYSLAFQHYPIQEYRPKDAFPIVGQYNEKHKLKSKTDPATRRLLSEINVQAMSVGAEHTNECCIFSDGKPEKLNGLWMCFGGSVGEGACSVGKHDRRVRLFRIDNNVKEIASWKRRQGAPLDVFDYQYITQG